MAPKTLSFFKTAFDAVADAVGDVAVAIKIKIVAAVLKDLQGEVDQLKKDGKPDEPWRSDLGKLTLALKKIKDSKDSDTDKLKQLDKLYTLGKQKRSDAKISGVDPTDPKAGKLIASAIESRFGIKFALEEGVEDGVDDDGETKYKHKTLDPKKEADTLKHLYETLSKVPVFPNSHLEKITVTLMPADADGEGGWYDPGDHTVGIECMRPGDSSNQGDELGSRNYFPDGIEDDCKPANNDAVSYFDWATLHEVGHGVDEKHGFMTKKGGDTKFGGWVDYGSKVGPIAKVVAGKFGGDHSLGKDDLTALEAFTKVYMADGTPADARSDEESNARADVEEWVDAVRESEGLWWDGAGSKSRAIGGVVYQEAYEGSWVSYKLAARTQGIHGYQFRAPAEWFAELYAAQYLGKLKASHPFAPELKKLEAK